MNKRAFTLVEMLVGITISMILMTSIWVFISSWMSNIAFQQKILSDNQSFTAHLWDIQELVSDSTHIAFSGSTGVLLKSTQNFDTWWYTYLWTKTITDNYCQELDTRNTTHLFTSNFIPYEEIWEDINSTFSDIENSDITIWWITYRSNTKNHQILDSTNSVTVVWKDIFWNKMSEGSVWTGVFLNSPTWMVEVDSKLVFSDTLNNRILYLSWGLVYTLLDEKNWLQEPTWLAYSWGTLYISNSAKWEILKFSSVEQTVNPDLEIFFTPDVDFDADRFSVSIHWWSVTLDSSMDKSNFTLVTDSNSDDNITVLWNVLNYYYISSFTAESAQSSCAWTEFEEAWGNLIQCTQSWTWTVANMDTNTFNAWTDYWINITNVLPLLTGENHYYVSLDFHDWATLSYSEKFPYFTQWDWDIFTKDDNILEIFTGGLLYPTWLWFNGWNLIVNTFEDRKEQEFDLTWNYVWDSPLIGFSESVFNNYPEFSILDNPIKDIIIDTTGNFLNLKLDYYKFLNCFNSDEKVEKTLLLKKSF